MSIADELRRKCLEMAERAEADETCAEDGTMKVQLPLWPEHKLAAPPALLRSALFGVAKRGRRPMVNSETVATWPGVRIKYTGPRLHQSDLDVWMALLSLWLRNEGRCSFEVGLREMMRLAGRKGGNTAWVWRDIVRLSATAVEVVAGHRRYVGSLVDEAAFDEDLKRYTVRINPRLAALFGADMTHLDASARAALGSDLAKWLQAYVCSHKATERHPHMIGLDKLQPLTGSTTHRRDFRLKLKAAMADLERAGIVTAWAVGKNLVFVR